VWFADTNVLLYAISRDPQEGMKAERAKQLLASRDLGLSVQVLAEFYVQSTRASRADRLTHDQAFDLVDSFRRFSVQGMTIDLVLAAMSTGQKFGISYWDAAIVEAARVLDCYGVLSEDLSDGQDYAGIRVENPFRDC
jgi:predicted nucleic acid-binding protein